ncbi:MAG: hypothetical protein ACI4SR_07900 [Faecalibacillus sp.]
MDVNDILAKRFNKFFKYLRNMSIIAFIAFVILNAINTGNDILYWIIYICLMISIAGAVECVALYLLSKYYMNKSNK